MTPELWTAASVRRRLTEAITLVERSTARPGPKAVRSAWPEIQPDGRDLWFASAGDVAADRNRWRIGATSEEIAEADEALAWLRFVRHERPKEGVMLWLRAEARGIPFRQAALRAGLAYRTVIRYRDDAIASIVDELNRNRDCCNITRE